MKNYIKLLLVIITMLIFTPDNVFPQSDENVKVESISGVLIEINEKDMTVYIRSSSRVVKLYATPEICAEFRNRINSDVYIYFTRRYTEGLQLIKMDIIPKTDNDSSVPESSDKKQKTEIN